MRKWLIYPIGFLTNAIRNKCSNYSLCLLLAVFVSTQVSAQYSQSKHKALSGDEILVSKPENYAKPSATYLLTNDIIWPGAEQLINREQYQIVLARYGGEGSDKRTPRIWWDTNPDPYKPHPEPVERIDLPWEDWVQN